MKMNSTFHPDALTVAFILLIGFFLIERFLRFGSEAKSFRASVTDRLSTAVLILSFALDTICLYYRNHFNDLFGWAVMKHDGLAYFGIILMIAGLFIRIRATLTLKESYTRTLKIRKDQHLVKKGLYKYIRHPGYLGLILLWAGAGLSSGNELIFILVVVITLAAYTYRINSEERMLSQAFGEEYFNYREHSWRLLPFIF